MITVVLRRRFIFAPPMLSTVIKPFSGHEHTFRLYELVQEYLPEERGKIVGIMPAAAAQEFIKLFSAKYFKIEVKNPYGNAQDVVRRLVNAIPADIDYMQHNDYIPYDRKIPQSQLLAEVLCICPFEGRDDRLSVVDEFRKQLGSSAAGLIERIPNGGYPLKDLEAALKDSPYPGLLHLCRWVMGKTGNIWLDPPPDRHVLLWSRENVERLARDLPAYRETQKQIKAFDSWCGHQRNERFEEVISYITQKRGEHGKARKKG